jgi:hypothetical protein
VLENLGLREPAAELDERSRRALQARNATCWLPGSFYDPPVPVPCTRWAPGVECDPTLGVHTAATEADAVAAGSEMGVSCILFSVWYDDEGSDDVAPWRFACCV